MKFRQCLLAGIACLLAVSPGFRVEAEGAAPVQVTVQANGPGSVEVSQDGMETRTVQESTLEFPAQPGDTITFTPSTDQVDATVNEEAVDLPSLENWTVPEADATLTFTFHEPEPVEEESLPEEPENQPADTALILDDYAKDETSKWKDARLELAEKMKLSGWLDDDGFLKDSFYREKPLNWLIAQGGSILSRDFTGAYKAAAVSTANAWSQIQPRATYSGKISVQSSTAYTYRALGGAAAISNGLWLLSNGETAFCGSGMRAEPLAGDTAQAPVSNVSVAVRKALYYGYGGPKDMLTSRFGVEGAVVFTNDLVSLAHSGKCIAKEAANGWWWTNYVEALNAEIQAMPDPPYQYKARTVHVDGMGTNWQGTPYCSKQDLIYGFLQEEAIIQVNKSSADAFTKTNKRYELWKAQYGLYNSKGTQLDTIQIGVDGIGMTLLSKQGKDTIQGTYTIKETKAPKGYELDPAAHTVTLDYDDVALVRTKELDVKDKPLSLKPELLLQKTDADGSVSPALANAEFTFKFYESVSGTDDPAAAGKKPARTWVLKTDAQGKIKLDNAHKVSGDAFYSHSDGTLCIPYGVLTVTETKAPDGYLLDGKTLVVDTEQANPKNVFGTVRNTPINLVLKKTQAGNGVPVPGTEFTHTLPNGNTETVTTDDNGEIHLERLAYGSHKIEEKKAVTGYQAISVPFTFTVDGNGIAAADQFPWQMDFANATLQLENHPFDYKLHIVKQDEDGRLLEGAEFSLYETKDAADPVESVVTGADGTASFENLEPNRSYWVAETMAPFGHKLPLQDGEPVRLEIRMDSIPAAGIQSFAAEGKELDVLGSVESPAVTMTVVNGAVLILPNAGLSAGAVSIGLAAAAAAAGALWLRKRNRH